MATVSTLGFEAKLALARQGDRIALGEPLEQARPQLLRHSKLSVGTVLQTRVCHQDIVQDVLINAISGFPEFRSDEEIQFDHWLLTILNHHLATLLRRHVGSQKRSLQFERNVNRASEPAHAQSSRILSDTTPSRKAMASEQDLNLQKTLEELSPIGQETIRLRNYENMSFQQIAAIQGCTPKAAQKRYTRAMLLLGQKLRRQP